VSIEQVKWEELFKEWEQEPIKAFAWLMARFLEAGISMQEAVSWLAKDKEIRIGNLKFLMEHSNK
jgi:hypothetical protein